MSRTVHMLALTLLVGCRVQAPAKPCAGVILGACAEATTAPVPCERGRARSLDDGSCTSSRDARDLARAAGVYIGENDVIECESASDELVASLRVGRIGCIPREPPPSPSSECPERSVRTATGCAPLDRGGTVDLASWTRAAAAHACARLLRSPFVLSAPEIALEVDLHASVPNNDLTAGYVRLHTRPAIPDADRARALAAVDDALRRLGGTASASDVSAAATCTASTRRPISVP